MRKIGWLAAMAVLAAGALAQDHVPTLTATAVGCHWRYIYDGPDGTTVFDPTKTPCLTPYCPLGLDPDRAAAVPAGALVHVVAKTADTLRVLSVPPLGLQLEAAPGKPGEATLQAKVEGLYPGRQGADCVKDPTAVAPAFRVLDRSSFEDWLKRKRHGE